MNISAIRAVQAALMAPEPIATFDMGVTIHRHSCGTAACIAGFAVLLDDPNYNPFNSVIDQAQILLGLTSTEAYHLFCPSTDAIGGLFYPDLTPTMAVATLDHLINTGEVKWQI